MPRGPRASAALATSSATLSTSRGFATGQITDDVPPPEDEGKDPAAVALGRNGGKARAEAVRRQAASGDRA